MNAYVSRHEGDGHIRNCNSQPAQLMKRILFSLLLSAVFQTCCRAEVTRLPADDQKVLRDVSRFHEIHGATNLPPAIFALCADGNGRLAEPGKDWNPTDVIIDDTLPRKRFIWAVTDGNYYVVHYERGGVGYGANFLVARLKAGESKPSFIWLGFGIRRQPLKNYPAFLKALRNGKVDDNFDWTLNH